ncbi:oxidoreductase [Carbonactinospora thermoautotrophica]|uniref:Oxidoreductase n=1 Tax=Carbonactinospora thermoautotrophica TaxID=1469144 RepID=A0A132MIE1_9ACTN|nr:2Fe-2S iron-sulfur cluster-binding protein [Carbonactinospora thermoautotrophica]KWW97604.1 oxidoreductase [Carbonactinospora thermoautotrophica]KWW98965.1 Oxidoreductase FAD/NAD(P)-binding domain protein [Carbonactinospora thermoautotrophica]KWX09981.1 oxidoreductase [Carbonactinospora thermoautotrophica]
MPATYRVTVEPLGQQVDCREDQPILDACLRAGIWLPHACTHGTCGTCKVEILDGEVDHGDASTFALMDFERDEGKTLLCCARPRSDVTIEGDVEVEEGVTTYPVRDFVGTVAAVEDCATDTRRLLIDLDHDIAFNPGQYVSLEVPGTGVSRTYSMANPPAESRRIELHIRRTPGGLASDGWIFKTLAPGDTVRLSGPYGRFFWRPARTEPAICIAGGTGLAPIKAMIRHVLETGADREIILYHGGRTAAHMYDVDYFRALEEAHPDRFRYRPCLSDEQAAGYQTGLVTDVLAAEMDTCRGHVAYVCGPPPMVEAALRTLMAKRLFPRDIYREDFYDASDKAAANVRSPLLKR